MRLFLYGAFWIGIYFTVSVAPLFVLLIGDTPPGRGFWREFSVGLGFLGMSMLGWQFFLTGRFKSITSPYGIDVVYHFHRLVSLIAFLFILLHPVIIFISTPVTLVFLNPLSSPWWINVGFLSLLAFAVIIVTSLYRLNLGMKYEHWSIIHSYTSVIAVALSTIHIVGVSYYVHEPLKRWLWIFMVAAWILGLAYIRILKPLLMLRRPYTVREVVKERGDSWTLEFTPEGHDGMNFRPGQFAWLILEKSPFAVREHPFSFSSSAMHPERPAITIKELGDFTSQIGGILPGTRAYIDGPYGTFSIDRQRSQGYVCIAGGVGITPIMSMLRTMNDRSDRRPVTLFYGAKTWEDATFREEIENMKASLNLQVVYVIEDAPEGWEGEKGYITAEVLSRNLSEHRYDYEYYVCGPQPMQTAVKKALDKLGLPMERVNSESFNFV